MVEALRDAGIDHRDVLERAALPIDLLDTPGPRVTIRDYYALWQATVTASGNPAIGVVLATLIRPEITEPLFLAVLNAPDVAGAIDIVVRYKRIFEPQDLVIEADDATGQVTLTLPDPDAALRQPSVLIDTQFAFILEMCRRGTGRADLRPREMRLRVKTLDAPAYAAFYRCPIVIGAPTNSLVFDGEVMAMPFVTHNPQMLNALVPYLRNVTPDSSIPAVARVRSVMGERLRGNRPTIEAIGRELAMSTRGLQRVLRDSGTTFRRLLDEVRNDHAQAYLASTAFTTSEVAFLLGFEDESSFSRAFRTWNGLSPTAFRKRSGAGVPGGSAD